MHVARINYNGEVREGGGERQGKEQEKSKRERE